jgi:hypothetical protein
MRRFLFILLTLVLVISSVSAQSARQRGAQVLSNGGTLQDAAREARGHYVGTGGGSSFFEYPTLHDLAKHSHTIVTGTAITNVCQLSADGRDVYTAYSFRVDEKIKGSGIHPGDMITVDLPGGRVSFPDGSTAQINTPQFPRMVNGNRYVLFLQERGKSASFTPVGGPQGVFELRTDGTIFAHARSFNSMSRHTGDKSDDFVRQTKDAAEKDN